MTASLRSVGVGASRLKLPPMSHVGSFETCRGGPFRRWSAPTYHGVDMPAGPALFSGGFHAQFLGYAKRLALFCSMLPILLSASTERADALPPVELAVFEFELEDFSGGSSILPANPSDFEQLKHVTNEARQLIAQAGRYTVVDVSSADTEAVRAHSLRNCDGCDAGIALKFGAQQSLVGFVTRISRTGIHGSVSDSRRPDRCRRLQSADRSSHGRHRILEPRSGLVDQESVVAEPGLATRRGLGSQTFGFTLCLHL